MMRSGTGGASAALLLFVVAPPALAVTIPELICQQSTGKESLRFLKRVHKAARLCADAPTRGQVCDGDRRDDTIAAAVARFHSTLGGRCDGIVLESLGFPASCPDPGGAPFSTDDLVTCMSDSHRERVAAAIATAYPDGAGPLDRGEARCQRQIGNAGERLLLKRLRARQSCLNDQLSGRVDAGVDCRAQPPPGAPGTGHGKTDRRLTTAVIRLERLLARGCSDIVLESLGFPAACTDLGGPPFALDDLQACVRDRYTREADAMLDLEYPASSGP